MLKPLFILLIISSWMMAMELPKESQAIGLASSLAGTYFLLKASKAQYELRSTMLSDSERTTLIFCRDVYLAAGASSKLSSYLILLPQVATCHNPVQTWKVIESSAVCIAAGVICLEQAYKEHNDLELKPWRKKNRDEFLVCGMAAIGFGGLLGSLLYCTDEDV